MDRRKFLRNTVPAAVTLPAFLNGFSFTALGAESDDVLTRLLGQTASNDHVLVLIQLGGGNDGLNMVVPVGYVCQLLQCKAQCSNTAKPGIEIGWY
ncbi:MAG: hypothetical protein V9F01_09810 [Chitinophagaceae bacterium]